MSGGTQRIVATVAGLAKQSGVHRSTAARWVGQGCPRRPDGTFDVDEVLAWHADHKARAMDRSVPKPREPDPLRVARAAREQLKLKVEELAFRKLEGELIEREEVASMLVTRARAMQKALRAMGRKLGRKHGREVQRAIERAVDQVLREAYGQNERPEKVRRKR